MISGWKSNLCTGCNLILPGDALFKLDGVLNREGKVVSSVSPLSCVSDAGSGADSVPREASRGVTIVSLTISGIGRVQVVSRRLNISWNIPSSRSEFLEAVLSDKTMKRRGAVVSTLVVVNSSSDSSTKSNKASQ